MKKHIIISIFALGLASIMTVVTAQGIEFFQATALLSDNAGKFIGAGLAVGLAGLGAGLGMGTTGAAGIGAVSEDRRNLTSSLIFIVFIETIALYGLLISILLIYA